MNLVKYAHFLDTCGRGTEADSLFLIIDMLGANEAIRVTKELIAEGKLPAMPEE
jgi:hypothetical protein